MNLEPAEEVRIPVSCMGGKGPIHPTLKPDVHGWPKQSVVKKHKLILSSGFFAI